MKAQRNLDVQPEIDLPGSELMTLSMGLALGCGLILGGALGSLGGHFLLDNAFGLGQDILVGAMIGVIVVCTLAYYGVMKLSARMAGHE